MIVKLVHEQAEDFLRAHSATASVPSAPLSVVQASAEALETDLDQKPAHAAAHSGEQQLSREESVERAESSARCQTAAGEWSPVSNRSWIISPAALMLASCVTCHLFVKEVNEKLGWQPSSSLDISD